MKAQGSFSQCSVINRKHETVDHICVRDTVLGKLIEMRK